MAGYWLKLYTEILDDPKYHRLSEAGKLGMIELMIVAKKHDRDGELPCIEDIAFYTRRDVEWWLPVLDELRGIAYLIEDNGHDLIRKFEERQAAVTEAKRINEYRKRKQQEEYACNDPVTKIQNIVTEKQIQSRTDTELESESESEAEDIAKSKNMPENQALMAVFDITGFTALPSRWREDAEAAIDSLWQQYPGREKLREYLRPYWLAWTERQYNKTNMGWLDWAVTGDIPPPRKNGKVTAGGAHQRASAAEISEGAEILRKAMKR